MVAGQGVKRAGYAPAPPPLSGFKEGARELVQRLLHQKIPVVGDCELSTVYL